MQVPTLKVNTRLVVVDVVASDSKGVPITDLKADDFTVQEEGVEQPIQVFSFHHSGNSVEPDAPGPWVSQAKLPPNIFTNVPQYKTSGALNVLLLDAFNTSLPNQAATRDAMIKLIAKLPAGEPIAIYLLGTQLTLIQDFTSDPAVLQKAVAGLKRQGPRAVANAAGTTRMAEMPIGSVAWYTIAANIPSLTAKLENFQDMEAAGQADYRVRFSLDVLNALAHTLSGYPGRKNLIWVSESFPFAIVVDKKADAEANAVSGTTMTAVTAGMRNDRDFSREMARTGSLLSDAQIAIYPVDAHGLNGNGDFSVGKDPNPIGNPGILKTTLDDEAGKVAHQEFEDRMGVRNTMNDIADKTGGRAFYNTNNLEGAVRKSLEDGSTYYTLGYYPGNKNWNGSFRRISVKTIRPGVKLHYRQGYFALEPLSYAKLDDARKASDLAQALSLNFPAATALRFQAAIVPPSTTNNKVLINFAVDPHQLAFDLGSDGLQHASVDCAVIVYSQKGETVQTLSNTMVAALKPDEYARVMQRSFPCRQTLDLQPGQYGLRLGVRDARIGMLGTLNAPLTVPAATSSAQPAEEKKP
jgi:VWFA-related protein